MKDNTITLYLKEVSRHPLLSKEEEKMYAEILISAKNKIASTLSSPASVDKFVEAIQDAYDEGKYSDEELDEILLLSNYLNESNVPLLKDKLKEADFSVLKNYASNYTKLEPILEAVKVAREKLINSNLKLVISIAKRFSKSGMPFIDLIQEGNMGLIKAVDKFDVSRGNKLATLATWWIKQAIIRALSNKSRIIRVPVHMIDSMNRAYRSVIDQGKDPTAENIQQELTGQNLTLSEVKEIMDIMQGPVSINETIGDDDDSTYESFLEDDGPDPEETTINARVFDTILKEIEALPPKEYRVLRLRLGV